MSDREDAPGPLLLTLATEHHDIRGFLDRLDHDPEPRSEVAEELSLLLARHRSSCTESVLALVANQRQELELQARLLLTATRGVDQLVDRLRLPCGDARLVRTVLEGLRALTREHERLELELLVALSSAEHDSTPIQPDRERQPG
jgi:hypothetical protein